MTIYRIEDEKGIGCYTSEVKDNNRNIGNMLKKHDDNIYKCPTPYYDNGIERRAKREEICGFVSLEQAYNWFSEKEIRKLKKVGFDFKEIKVKKITAVGEKQCLAIR